MSDHFYTIDVAIPAELASVFKTLRLCSNGAIVAAYRVPVLLAAVNVGDETIAELAHGLVTSVVVTPGAMVALDMRVQQ